MTGTDHGQTLGSSSMPTGNSKQVLPYFWEQSAACYLSLSASHSPQHKHGFAEQQHAQFEAAKFLLCDYFL